MPLFFPFVFLLFSLFLSVLLSSFFSPIPLSQMFHRLSFPPKGETGESSERQRKIGERPKDFFRLLSIIFFPDIIYPVTGYIIMEHSKERLKKNLFSVGKEKPSFFCPGSIGGFGGKLRKRTSGKRRIKEREREFRGI